jgi:2-iminobutanoate/2-iminopropanoate deaminase
MPNAAITTDRAPAAIGPYSQAVRAGDFVFTSGQIGLDPATGEIVPGGVEAEARRVLDNLTAVLEAAGARWSDVVRTAIYLTDLGDFARVNKLYGERVGAGVLPARSTVQVAGLPRGAAVEIDAVAYVPRRSSAG